VRYVFEVGAILLLLLMIMMAARARRNSAQVQSRLQRDIAVGTRVMTTSGLYGTVTALNSDDTVILSIAPGVEVRWAFAALRDAAALPPRYRPAVHQQQHSPGIGGNGADAPKQ
jgi:preprotein translocase subunit YajC